MKLLVLAGGFGTRLKTTVKDVPKALAPINGEPFLKLQIEGWLKQGIRDFNFLLHYQADQIIAFLEMQQSLILKDCKVAWLIEPTPMDTGGAIAYAVTKLNLQQDFLAINADTWLSGGISEMLQAITPSIAVVNLANISRYGQVYFDNNKLVYAFKEKESKSTAGWISAGMYRLSPEYFRDWHGRPFSLERDLFYRLAQRRILNAVPLQVDFIDIGLPDDYHFFCQRSFNSGMIIR